MRKLITLLSILLFICVQLFSQNIAQEPTIKRHSIYSELGGNSGLYSLNYDFMMSITENLKCAVGTGAGYIYVISDIRSHGTAYLTPCANFLFGKASHNIEVGASLLTAWDGILIPCGRLGYRYQPKYGGYLFRIGFTPIFANDKINPWGGVSFGCTF